VARIFDWIDQATGCKLLAIKKYRPMRNFKKLLIWQLVMRSQMTRSSTAIPSNIAEGSAKRSQKDYARYCEISLASAFELETHTRIVKKRKWVKEELIDELLALIEKEQKDVDQVH
jgi:four helix bundle protein